MAEISPAWIALIGTIFGGAGLKFIESWLNRGAKIAERRSADATEIRGELKLIIDGLKADQARLLKQIDDTEAEANAWREKYWDLMAQYSKMQVELLTAVARLKERADEDTKFVTETGDTATGMKDRRAAEDGIKQQSNKFDSYETREENEAHGGTAQ